MDSCSYMERTEACDQSFGQKGTRSGRRCDLDLASGESPGRGAPVPVKTGLGCGGAGVETFREKKEDIPNRALAQQSGGGETQHSLYFPRLRIVLWSMAKQEVAQCQYNLYSFMKERTKV